MGRLKYIWPSIPQAGNDRGQHGHRFSIAGSCHVRSRPVIGSGFMGGQTSFSSSGGNLVTQEAKDSCLEELSVDNWSLKSPMRNYCKLK
jgi:hypothetical protein